MYLWYDPLRDQQEQPQVGTCARCGKELLPSDDDEICSDCIKDLKKYDAYTVDAVINALVCELNRYLSERLVDKVRASMYQQYPLDKMEKRKRTGYDPRTVTAVMDDMDYELKKYLSDDLRNKVWNALVVQFPMEEMEA